MIRLTKLLRIEKPRQTLSFFFLCLSMVMTTVGMRHFLIRNFDDVIIKLTPLPRFVYIVSTWYPLFISREGGRQRTTESSFDLRGESIRREVRYVLDSVPEKGTDVEVSLPKTKRNNKARSWRQDEINKV